LMTNAVRIFTARCVAGMRPNTESCEFWVERSSALATALMPRFGYARSAQIAQQALAQGLTIRQWVLQEGLLTDQEAAIILDLRRLTEPGVPS